MTRKERSDINEQAGRLWDHLKKTAKLVNTPVNLMSSRTYKAKKREFSIPDDVAELHVSDVLATFLEKSDEKVEKIISGDGDIKHYLTKCVMTSVMSVRSAVNYKKLGDRITDSLDAPLGTDDDGGTFLDYLASPIEDGVKKELLSIVHEGLIGQSESDLYIFERLCFDGIKCTELVKEDRVEHGYQKCLTIRNHLMKIILIYVATPEIKERVRQILS
tara:strand:- start:230 stop:883 length:654 start_codon:yes stop_codon:yes gene_type:complete